MSAYDVAAYVWPAYTGQEPRMRLFWPGGRGEWESVERAACLHKSKADGTDYCWGRRPLWGCVDEADPRVMEQQIAAAADHGVNVFAYDWYYYDRRPIMESCLDKGFLGAVNRSRMRFYLMWANHDATHLWHYPTSATQLDTVVWTGRVGSEDFAQLGRRLIRKYFRLPEYYCIDGKPLFAIYDLDNFVRGLGSIEAAAEALRGLRAEARAAALPGLHIQVILWGEAQNISGVDGEKSLNLDEAVRLLCADSLTHYQYVHFTDIDRPYAEILPDVVAAWERCAARFDVPYFPHVSLGWDNNPRFACFRPGILRDNDKAAIKVALQAARAYLDARRLPARLLTINSWNEWTESSYLQPDNLNGYDYLEAVREVFATHAEA